MNQKEVRMESKKKLIEIGGIILCLLLVGIVCFLIGTLREKVLTCSTSETVEGVKISRTEKYYFQRNGKNVKKYTTEMKASYDDTYDEEELNEIVESGKSGCQQYDETTGISCRIYQQGKTVVQTITIDFHKISDADAAQYEIDKDSYKEYEYDEIKKEAEQYGYTCS